MSVASLLDSTCQITSTLPLDPPDALGRPGRPTTLTATVRCRVSSPKPGAYDDRRDGLTVVDAVAYFDADVPLKPTDRLTIDGQDYDVVGVPVALASPLSGPSHVKVPLRLVRDVA